MKELTFCKICTSKLKKYFFFMNILIQKDIKIVKIILFRNVWLFAKTVTKKQKNDEWREHIISQKHTKFEEKNYWNVFPAKW